MGQVLSSEGTSEPPPTADATRRRPVVLATLSVRVDPRAERMAIDSALEVGAHLIIDNMLTLPPYQTTAMLARQYVTLPHEQDPAAVRATPRRAHRLGSKT